MNIPCPAATVPGVSGALAPRLELNGRAATIEDIWALDRSDTGHFTAMQVRDHATPGLDFHLARLDSATRELFGVELDGDRVRACIRHALADDIADATIRVNVFRRDAAGDVSLMVGVRPPAPAPKQALRLQSVEYQRPDPHIKHAAGFGQGYFSGLAAGNGFDEALFVGPDGRVSEGSITNIAFVDGVGIVWPDAPALRGIMMQVLQRELDAAGLPWRSAPVHLRDVDMFAGAFLTNAHGMATIARIDGAELQTDAPLLRRAGELLAAAPADPI
jgi:branched-subunit amino acid aminotransferase/4-amino-4-deoxychorismate lyase